MLFAAKQNQPGDAFVAAAGDIVAEANAGMERMTAKFNEEGGEALCEGGGSHSIA